MRCGPPACRQRRSCSTQPMATTASSAPGSPRRACRTWPVCSPAYWSGGSATHRRRQPRVGRGGARRARRVQAGPGQDAGHGTGPPTPGRPSPGGRAATCCSPPALPACGCARRSQAAGRSELAAEQWLLIEWPVGEAAPDHFWLSSLPADIGFERMVDLAKSAGGSSAIISNSSKRSDWATSRAAGGGAFITMPVSASRPCLPGLRAGDFPPSGGAGAEYRRRSGIPVDYRSRGAATANTAPHAELHLQRCASGWHELWSALCRDVPAADKCTKGPKYRHDDTVGLGRNAKSGTRVAAAMGLHAGSLTTAVRHRPWLRVIAAGR